MDTEKIIINEFGLRQPMCFTRFNHSCHTTSPLLDKTDIIENTGYSFVPEYRCMWFMQFIQGYA